MTDPTLDVIGYRFRMVELDLLRGSLRVDGVDVVATPLPMKLLGLLCERGGELCSRDDIFEHVWPRQEISDDALNKLISRLRELLGRAADSVVTVRKQGLRLDAPVERIYRSPANSSPMLVDLPDSPAIAAPAPRRLHPAMWVSFAILVVLTLLAWRVPRQSASPDPDVMVYIGYALRSSDLRAGRADTLDLVGAAEQAMNRGDGTQARQLLRSAELSETQSALLPALRAIEYGSDDPEPVAELLARASARLNAHDSPYVHLMVSYAKARQQSLEAERAAVDALLTLRPTAWRLRLRRAHIDIQASHADSALRHLRAIPIEHLPVQTLMYVLSDRVSYGDGAAVTEILRNGALKDHPLQRAYVEARLAWTARAVDTGERLASLADAAEAAGAFGLSSHCRELVAAFAYATAAPQAQALLRRAAYNVREAGHVQNAAPLLALAADLAASAGSQDEASDLMKQALSVSGPPTVRVELEISNARLNLLPRGSFLETAGGTDDRFRRGEPALIAAWYAWVSGARQQASAALTEARAGGIEGSPHAQSAALLAMELGEAASDCWLDPPYPDLLRIASCRRLQQRFYSEHAIQADLP